MLIKNFNKNLISEIKHANKVFVIGHNYLDLDALGACVGIATLCDVLKTQATIILPNKKNEVGVKRALEMFDFGISAINKEEVEDISPKDLLIIVDTNNPELIDTKILGEFKNYIFIDHHTFVSGKLPGLKWIDTDYSSACEMVAELLIFNKVKVTGELSTLLLSGIVMDTCNYAIRVTANTFFISYKLMEMGGNVSLVQNLLKSDLKSYNKRQKVINDVLVIKNIAISKGLQTETYKREELAKIADTLLLFDGIDTSFSIGKLSKKAIGISARSIGNIDVSKIMSYFGGGGDDNVAAAKVENTTIRKIELELINYINKV